MLDRQIWGYIETEKKHRKVNNFGPFAFLPFTLFVSVEHWYTTKQRVGASILYFGKMSLIDMILCGCFLVSPYLLNSLQGLKLGVGVAEEIQQVARVNRCDFYRG